MLSFRARFAALPVVAAVLVVPAFPHAATAATGSAPVTYAGGGYGDGGAAVNAWLSPWTGTRHVAVDTAGNLYIPDSWANVVRRVDATTGVITRFAGTGAEGSGGDGGPATSATLDGPTAVAFTADGSMLIADRLAGRIRRVAPGGTITTLALVDAPSNVYVASDGDIYVTEDTAVRRLSTDGTDLGVVFETWLVGPTDVVRDADGVLYVAYDNRVWRVATDGTTTSVAGTGNTANGPGNGGPATAASFAGITSVSLGSGGSIVVHDNAYGVRSFVPGGTIDVVAPMPCMGDVEPEPAGTFLIACTYDVRRVTADGSANEILAGTETGVVGDGLPATDARLAGLRGMAADSQGNLFVVEKWGDRVRRVGADGVITTVAGSTAGDVAEGDGGPATLARLRNPAEVAVAADGTPTSRTAPTAPCGRSPRAAPSRRSRAG